MFLVNVDTSLEIMDAMINNETISHTEAKKLMVKQVKPVHRNFLLDTLDHTEEEFSFSSYVADMDLMDKKITKNVVGKFYKKSDVLLAIEEYKANGTLKNQLEVLAKEFKIKEEQQRESELVQREQAYKFFIVERAKQILEENNKEETNNAFDPFELLMSVNNTMSYDEAYQQAKKEIIGV